MQRDYIIHKDDSLMMNGFETANLNTVSPIDEPIDTYKYQRNKLEPKINIEAVEEIDGMEESELKCESERR